MNERRFRQLNILTIIAVAVGIGMMLFFAFVVSDGGNQKISFRTPKKLDDTWVLYRQGETDEQIIDLPTKLKAKKGEIFYYPASCDHYLENPGKTPAVILWISSPPYF